MAIYEYRCPHCERVYREAAAMGRQSAVVSCEVCLCEAPRLYHVPDFVYPGSRHRFHNDGSIAMQRKQAVGDMKKFVAKSQRNGGSYHEDMFSFADPTGGGG